MRMEYEEITEKVIGVFYEVYRTLGPGFLEKVYEKAMEIEFRRREIKFGRQVGVDVCYKGENSGEYAADFIVEGEVCTEAED